MPRALGKTQKTLGKPFIGKYCFAECQSSGTRQRLCRVQKKHSTNIFWEKKQVAGSTTTPPSPPPPQLPATTTTTTTKAAGEEEGGGEGRPLDPPPPRPRPHLRHWIRCHQGRARMESKDGEGPSSPPAPLRPNHWRIRPPWARIRPTRSRIRPPAADPATTVADPATTVIGEGDGGGGRAGR